MVLEPNKPFKEGNQSHSTDTVIFYFILENLLNTIKTHCDLDDYETGFTRLLTGN